MAWQKYDKNEFCTLLNSLPTKYVRVLVFIENEIRMATITAGFDNDVHVQVHGIYYMGTAPKPTHYMTLPENP